VVKNSDGYALDNNREESIGRVHGFFGNVSVLIRAYSYIRSMGPANLKKASQLAVLNGAYVKELLKDTLELAYDRPCMHESVFSDARQQPFKVTTLDLAKRLIDHGYHPPTIYFPLVVPGAIMIEPTETECKEDLDRFVEVFKTVAAEAETDGERLRQAPLVTKVRRLDETQAARKPWLTG
jgi:glycine dehydrogenase subunit 2